MTIMAYLPFAIISCIAIMAIVLLSVDTYRKARRMGRKDSMLFCVLAIGVAYITTVVVPLGAVMDMFMGCLVSFMCWAIAAHRCDDLAIDPFDGLI